MCIENSFLCKNYICLKTLTKLPEMMVSCKYKRIGGAGYRSRYLSHAKRALYHLSYAPYFKIIAIPKCKISEGKQCNLSPHYHNIADIRINCRSAEFKLLSIFIADLQNHTSTTFSWIPINICRDQKLPLNFGSGAKSWTHK